MGRRPVYVDLDVGQGSIAVPGSVGKLLIYLKNLVFVFSYHIQHCFIYRPSDSTGSNIEPRTVATGALAVRRSNH